jgi:hypothetical protein
MARDHLGEWHVAKSEQGWARAAPVPEIARSSPATRRAVAEKLEDFPRTLLVVENLCLHQHLLGLQRRHPQPRLRKADRQFRIPASLPVGAIRFWL